MPRSAWLPVMIDSQPSSTHSGGSSGSLIRNYLGFPHGISGASLATRAFEQARSLGAIPSMAGPVTGLQPATDGLTPRLADGQVSLTRSVLITTGMSYRKLDTPGLDSPARRWRLLRRDRIPSRRLRPQARLHHRQSRLRRARPQSTRLT
jgi:thioredoxin reductase